MAYIYNIYRSIGIEWIIVAMVTSNGLYQLTTPPHRRCRRAWFVLGNGLVCGLLVPLTRVIPFVPLFHTQGAAVWLLFAILILVNLLSAAVFLKNEFTSLLGYYMFYPLIILLCKMICAPLYAAEAALPVNLYIVLDLIASFILLLILYLMTRLFLRFRLNLSIPNRPKDYLIVLIIPFGIFCFFFVYVSGLSLSQDMARSLLCIILLVDLPILYYLFASILHEYDERFRLDRALMKTQMELDNNRRAIELDERVRAERHELKNNYQYIRMLLEQGRAEDAQQYLDQVLGEKMSSLDYVQTGNTMLDHIINEAIAEAHDHHIPIYTEIIVEPQIPIQENSLYTILLNLLHNAIEASAQSSEKDIRITIREARNYLVCKIANKVDHDILKENPSLRTTKSDAANHGLGMKIVNSEVDAQNGSFDVSMQDDYFCATVMLPLSVRGKADSDQT